MKIVYTGTPLDIKVNGIPFHNGSPVDVPEEMAAQLLKKSFFHAKEAPDTGPEKDKTKRSE